MIEKFQKEYSLPETRERIGFVFMRAPFPSNITELTIWADISLQSVIFNMRINGSPVFAGGSRPTIVAASDNFVTVSGLSEAVVLGDIVSLDIDQAPQGGVRNISFQVTYNDGLPVGATAFSTNITTASLADDAVEDGTKAIAKELIVKKITVDRDCRLRLFKTAAAQSADSARDFGDISYSGTQHQIILDILLDGTTGLEWEMSPEAIGSNGDDPVTTDIYYTIQNLSGSTHTVSVDIDYIAML